MWGTNGQDSGGEVRELLCRVSEAPTVGAIATKARLPGRKETTGVPTKMALPPPPQTELRFLPLAHLELSEPSWKVSGNHSLQGPLPSGPLRTGGDRRGQVDLQGLRNRKHCSRLLRGMRGQPKGGACLRSE